MSLRPYTGRRPGLSARITLLTLCLWMAMRSPDRWREAQYEKAIEARAYDLNRYVDLGVELRVVVADPKGEYLILGSGLKHKIIHRHKYGAVLDRQTGRFCKASTNRQIWYASLDQWQALNHRDPEIPGTIAFGSEGSGKSRIFPMWHYLMMLEHLGEDREGLQTAPTIKRLGIVRTEMFKLYPSDWYSYHAKDQILTFADKTRIRFVSTHKQSEDQGSPLQGFNASWAGRDEGQDQVAVHEDIENRGRSAKDGVYWQLITCTAKDHSDWRDFKTMLLESGLWKKIVMLGRNSPFVHPRFWDDKKKSMDPREYIRRIENPEADLPPELAVYHQFLRERNLVVRPQVALDITYAVLAGYESYTQPGKRFVMSAGHDPGVIYNSTTFKKLIMFGAVPTWVVVGEFQSKQTTARQHAKLVKQYVQETFKLETGDSAKVAFFCDPHGKGENETNFEQVYGAFMAEGLDIFNPMAIGGVINKKARVDMLNKLFHAADDSVRLVIATDHQGKPCAPRLVDALESLRKKEGDNNAEGTRRKNEKDKTHLPASLAYGLWSFETEFLSPQTIEVALREAKRVRI